MTTKVELRMPGAPLQGPFRPQRTDAPATRAPAETKFDPVVPFRGPASPAGDRAGAVLGWVRFGPFRLHLGRGELLREDQPVRLQPQATRLLVLLVSRAATLVTREEIQEHIWGSTVVDFEQGVHNAVRQIRTVLGDATESATFIETVPRRGYRFVAPVEPVPGVETGVVRPSWRSGWRIGLGIGAAAVLIALTAIWSWPGSDAEQTPGVPESYLKGRHLLAMNQLSAAERAIPMMEEAVRAAPNLAEVHAGLAAAVLAAPNPRIRLDVARRAAARAGELSPRLAEAHVLAGRIAFFFDWDWAAAQSAFAEASRLAPRDPLVLVERAQMLAAIGRHDEAIELGKTALALDPVSVTVRSDLGLVYFWADRFAEAARLWESLLELHPENTFARRALLESLLAMGAHEKARPVAVEVLRSFEATPAEIAELAAASPGQLGRRYAEFRLKRLEAEREAGRGVPPENLAYFHARLGHEEQALGFLEQAYEERCPSLVYLAVDPDLDRLRGNARFEALMHRVGLSGVARR